MATVAEECRRSTEGKIIVAEEIRGTVGCRRGDRAFIAATSQVDGQLQQRQQVAGKMGTAKESKGKAGGRWRVGAFVATVLLMMLAEAEGAEDSAGGRSGWEDGSTLSWIVAALCGGAAMWMGWVWQRRRGNSEGRRIEGGAAATIWRGGRRRNRRRSQRSVQHSGGWVRRRHKARMRYCKREDRRRKGRARSRRRQRRRRGRRKKRSRRRAVRGHNGVVGWKQMAGIVMLLIAVGGMQQAMAMETETGGTGPQGGMGEVMGAAAVALAAAGHSQGRTRRGGRIKMREIVDSDSDRSSSEDTEDSEDEGDDGARQEEEKTEEDKVKDRGYCTSSSQADGAWSAADEERWAGDNMDATTKKRGMVFNFLNPRRLCKVEGEEEEATMWARMKRLRADIVGLSDVGTVSDKKQWGQYGDSSGKAVKKARKWGGDHMRWLHAEGIEMERGAEGSKLTEGGVHTGVHERWRHRVTNYIEDGRGWGRFSGFVLQGAAGYDRYLVVITVYLPAKDTAAWRLQDAMLQTLRKEGAVGIETNPAAQALRDLHDVMFKQMTYQKRQVKFVVGGDFNMRWGAHHAEGPHGSIQSFAEGLELVNATRHRWEKQFWTCQGNAQGGGATLTAIDHILVSKVLANDGGILGIGVLQKEIVNSSDHRMLCMVLDPSPWLKITVNAMRLQKKQRKERRPKLMLKDEEQLLRYQQAVVQLWEEGKIAEQVRNLQATVVSAQEQGLAWGEDDEMVQRQMEQTMLAAVEALLQAHKATLGSATKTPKVRARRKQTGGEQVKQVSKRLRLLNNMLQSYDRRDLYSARKLSKAYGRTVGMDLGVHTRDGDTGGTESERKSKHTVAAMGIQSKEKN